MVFEPEATLVTFFFFTIAGTKPTGCVWFGFFAFVYTTGTGCAIIRLITPVVVQSNRVVVTGRAYFSLHTVLIRKGPRKGPLTALFL